MTTVPAAATVMIICTTVHMNISIWVFSACLSFSAWLSNILTDGRILYSFGTGRCLRGPTLGVQPATRPCDSPGPPQFNLNSCPAALPEMGWPGQALGEKQFFAVFFVPSSTQVGPVPAGNCLWGELHEEEGWSFSFPACQIFQLLSPPPTGGR